MTFRIKTKAILASIFILGLYMVPIIHKLFQWLPYSVEEQITCAFYLYLSVVFGVEFFDNIKPWKYIFMMPAAVGAVLLYQRGIFWGAFPCAGLFVAPLLSDLFELVLKACRITDNLMHEADARKTKWARLFFHIVELVLVCFTCYRYIGYLQ